MLPYFIYPWIFSPRRTFTKKYSGSRKKVPGCYSHSSPLPSPSSPPSGSLSSCSSYYNHNPMLPECILNSKPNARTISKFFPSCKIGSLRTSFATKIFSPMQGHLSASRNSATSTTRKCQDSTLPTTSRCLESTLCRCGSYLSAHWDCPSIGKLYWYTTNPRLTKCRTCLPTDMSARNTEHISNFR